MTTLCLIFCVMFQDRGESFFQQRDDPRYYALLIGIDQYANVKHLATPVRDVTDLAVLLMASYGFRQEDVWLLLDGQASRRGIFDSFEAMFQMAKSEDSVLIYFAGHGVEGKSQSGYWLPQDADTTSSSYIANSELIGFIERLKAKHVLVISDACFSGSFFEGTDTESVGTKYHFIDLYNTPSRWVITSGNRTTVDDRGLDYKNSPFAHHLLNYLEKNQEAYVSAHALFLDLGRSIASDSTVAQWPKAGPLPESGHKGGCFLFWNTSATRNGKVFPPPWRSNPEEYLPFYLKVLAGRHVLIENGGNPIMCKALERIGMQVTCDRGVRRRNGRVIVSYCSEIKYQSIIALIDYLGLKGYRTKTHGDRLELVRDDDCGKEFEITIRN